MHVLPQELVSNEQTASELKDVATHIAHESFAMASPNLPCNKRHKKDCVGITMDYHDRGPSHTITADSSIVSAGLKAISVELITVAFETVWIIRIPIKCPSSPA